MLGLNNLGEWKVKTEEAKCTIEGVNGLLIDAEERRLIATMGKQGVC